MTLIGVLLISFACYAAAFCTFLAVYRKQKRDKARKAEEERKRLEEEKRKQDEEERQAMLAHLAEVEAERKRLEKKREAKLKKEQEKRQKEQEAFEKEQRQKAWERWSNTEVPIKYAVMNVIYRQEPNKYFALIKDLSQNKYVVIEIPEEAYKSYVDLIGTKYYNSLDGNCAPYKSCSFTSNWEFDF